MRVEAQEIFMNSKPHSKPLNWLLLAQAQNTQVLGAEMCVVFGVQRTSIICFFPNLFSLGKVGWSGGQKRRKRKKWNEIWTNENINNAKCAKWANHALVLTSTEIL